MVDHFKDIIQMALIEIVLYLRLYYNHIMAASFLIEILVNQSQTVLSMSPV